MWSRSSAMLPLCTVWRGARPAVTPLHLPLLMAQPACGGCIRWMPSLCSTSECYLTIWITELLPQSTGLPAYELSACTSLGCIHLQSCIPQLFGMIVLAGPCYVQEAAMYTIRIGQVGVTDLRWWPGSSTTFGLSTQQGNVEVWCSCMH